MLHFSEAPAMSMLVLEGRARFLADTLRSIRWAVQLYESTASLLRINAEGRGTIFTPLLHSAYTIVKDGIARSGLSTYCVPAECCTLTVRAPVTLQALNVRNSPWGWGRQRSD